MASIKNSEYIFVYGTLKKDAATSIGNLLIQYGELFSDGHIQAKLYEVNGYPGAVESDEPSDKVFGELYSLHQAETVLPKLDEYEECTESFALPHEYIRKIIPVTLSDGDSIMAWVYIYNHEVRDLERIHSGDYS